MNVISLDISTKPGWAIFYDKKLSGFGTLWADKVAEDFGPYPVNYIKLAEHVAERLYKEVILPAKEFLKGADVHFVIEETTTSQNNYSQKKIEFVHYALVANYLRNEKVWYVRDGQWKGVVGARLNEEERKLNKQIKEYKEENKSKLAKLDLGDGKLRVVGKRKAQHAYMRAFSEQFGIALDIKHEDAAAACLMGLAFIKGVNLCDGKPKGGVGKKSGKANKRVGAGNKKTGHHSVA